MHLRQARRCLSLELLFPAFAALNVVLVLCSPGLVPEPLRVVAVWACLGLFAWVAARLAFLWEPAAPAVLVLASVALLFASYGALSLVIPWVAAEDREWLMLRLDRVFLGYTWEKAWSWAAAPLVSDGLQLVYTSFYGFPLLLGVALARKRDWWGLYNGLDRVMLGFLLSYCGYLILPVRSPYAFVEYARALPTWGLQPWLHDTIVQQSWTKRDCFPSGHTMMSCYVAWLAWQRARGIFWVLGPWALLTMTATLYLRYHYVVDVVAGLIACAAWILASDSLFGRFGTTARVGQVRMGGEQ